ncbi:MAG: hypothetical protein WCP35_16560 [Verrucomicrobiota bacterium]
MANDLLSKPIRLATGEMNPITVLLTPPDPADNFRHRDGGGFKRFATPSSPECPDPS